MAVDTTAPASYPAEWQTDVVLNDGSTAHFRPILPADRSLLAAFHSRQSAESIYFRFFRFRPELSDSELEYFTEVDYDARMAFVALQGDKLVAVARYETYDSPAHPGEKRAEVAFFVDDEHHGQGLATLMLEYLAAVARSRDFDGFTATVLPENVGMLRVFRRAGFEVSTRFADGVVEVALGIEVTPETRAAVSTRAWRAQAQSVRRLLSPSSIAVVGASRQPTTPGHDVTKRLLSGGFSGSISAVNPAALGAQVLGLDAVGSLADVDPVPDLAIVAAPAEAVPEVVGQAGEMGVGGLVVISAGFADAGPIGLAAERRLVGQARADGMRLIGPNSFGLINTDPAVRLNALFLPVRVSEGGVAVVSESGPLGAGLLDELHGAGVGVSSFVGIGNRADVSVTDLLAYWAEDDRTEVIAAYLDTWGNPRNVLPLLGHLCRSKPVVAVAPADAELAEVLAQAGVILTESPTELVVLCDLLSRQPVPRGDRVAIVSNAASVARLAANACRRHGLGVVAPAGSNATDSNVVLVGNADAVSLTPVDASMRREALVAAAVGDNVDQLLVALVPTPGLEPVELGELLDDVDRAIDKPLVAAGLIDGEALGGTGVPVQRFPEDAARALGRIGALARWRQDRSANDDEPIGPVPGLAELVSGLLGDSPVRRLALTDPEVVQLTGPLGLATPPARVVATAAQAAEAAAELGVPVVVKAAARGGRRSVGEAGGAAIDLRTPDDAAEAFERMESRFGSSFAPVLVQAMVTGGHQLAVSLRQDPQRGPRVQLGLGGLVGAPLGPLATLALPSTPSQLSVELFRHSWIRSIMGDRAEPTAALLELLGRLVAAGASTEEIESIEANPVVVSDEGVSPLDVVFTLKAWPDDPLAQVRHL